MPVAEATQTTEQKAELGALRALLDSEVPRKRSGSNLLIATWNIREFGSLTDKWRTTKADVPKRGLHDLACITEIVKRFDVVAIQEIQDDIRALRKMMKELGPRWAFIMTDITRGAKPGQEERLGFVFDTQRVQPSGLAAELVLPPDVDPKVVVEQFARTPYAVAFRSSGQTFLLVTLHVEFGASKDDRTGELRKIADWLADWAGEIAEWGQNLITLGDFNIDERGDDPNFLAFSSRGLHVPDEIAEFPSTIFQDVKHYDQVAWFDEDGGAPKLSLEYEGSAGAIDFTKVILRDVPKALDKSFRISDHLPLWVEFRIPRKGRRFEPSAPRD